MNKGWGFRVKTGMGKEVRGLIRVEHPLQSDRGVKGVGGMSELLLAAGQGQTHHSDGSSARGFFLTKYNFNAFKN